MAKCDYEFEGSELEEWLIEYYDKNGNIEGDSIKINLFMKELYKSINKDFDMISLPKGAQGVLYAGAHSNINMWKIVDNITGQTNDFYYISDTPAGAIMASQKSAFQDILVKIIGNEIVEYVFNSNLKEFPEIPGLEGIVNFNDFVSQNLAEKYVGNNGDALIFVSHSNFALISAYAP